MSAPSLLDLYRRARVEAFRLEARQVYAVPQESRQWQQWQATRAIIADPAVEKSMRIIREATGNGVFVHRAHILDLPLSDYLRYEMAAYAENEDAGEFVQIAVRAWHPGLAGLGEDFVLFDPGTHAGAVVFIHYDDSGHLTGTTYSNDPADIARAVAVRDLVTFHAIPLHEFAAMEAV